MSKKVSLTSVYVPTRHVLCDVDDFKYTSNDIIELLHEYWWILSQSELYMNELLLFIANSAIFQLYNGENMLILNEMMIRSALFKDQHTEFDLY